MAAVTGKISDVSFVNLSLPVIIGDNNLSAIDFKWEGVPSAFIDLVVTTLSQSLDDLVFVEKDRMSSSCQDCLSCLLYNELRAFREYSQT